MTDYSVDYFIAKFEAIPEEEWCVGEFELGDKHCAFGHCGMRTNVTSDEAEALNIIFTRSIGAFVTSINDSASNRYPQLTPKQRILAALRDIKAGQK